MQFTHTVTAADRPQLTAQILLTGQGLNQPDVMIQRALRRTVRVTGTTAPDAANLAFQSPPALAFLPGRATPIALRLVNNGTQNAVDARLRLTIPFGVDVDALDGGTYDAAGREITWEFGVLSPGASRLVTPVVVTDASAGIGTELVLDALLATQSEETDLEDNILTLSGQVALPAPTTVMLAPAPRDWLIADSQDRITLTLTVRDQLGAPVAAAQALLAASQPGLIFDPPLLVSDANGQAATEVEASEVGAVTVSATFANGASGATTLNRRASAVSLTHSPESIGVGGTDAYTLFVVNTATLPDGVTATGDLIDLTLTLPPELDADWFTFAQPTLPLGFGDFTETQLRVSLPPASMLPDCQALVGAFPFTVTATGQTLGVVGQAEGLLTITAAPPELTHVVPADHGRIGGDQLRFGWRSNTPGEGTIYYRRVGETAYTALPMTADALDSHLYSVALDVSAEPTGTVLEWYGEMSNGCSIRALGSASQPRAVTRVRSTTFADDGYDFTLVDGYALTTSAVGTPLTIQVRNGDTVSHAVLLDVENPYDDLILGFVGSGSVDQVVALVPGQTFTAPLQVFTQETKREVYSLMLRLENDAGDIDRVPLVIRVQQPTLDLDIQVTEVDPRTLVTRARLTNVGDTLTDLTLDIVQAATGIPANFLIQPDIQHSYLQAGQSLDIAFIPLSLDGTEAANMSTQAFDPLSGTTLVSFAQPALLEIPGPYRVTASARNITLPEVALRDGTLSSTCGADGSDRTVVAECTVPAGSETRIANSWYCTNRPDIDVPISLALPNGGLGVPVTNVSVAANFSPGGGVYNHSTTLSLNGSLVGSAIVPGTPRIEGSLAPQTLVLGGSSPVQRLNLRSTHNNQAHYTIASGFTVTMDYDEHTRTGCFTQAEIDAAAGGTLMCTGVPAFSIPPQSLDLSLDVDRSALSPEQLSNPYSYRVGEQIPLMAQIAATGQENISDTVQIALTVPRGLRPTGMTIQGEDQTLLDVIFSAIAEFLSSLGLPFSQVFDMGLAIAGDEQQVTFMYDYDRDLVIGQPFPITLEVVGEVVGEFTITGEASLQVDTSMAFSMPAVQSDEDGFDTVSDTVDLVLYQSRADFTNLDLTDGGEHQAAHAGIFWAIWNETSDDRQYFGRDADITYDGLSDEEIEQRFRDEQARQAASFLVENPYCNDGQNLAGDEPPNDGEGWASNIRGIVHCEDHRYLDANVILNGYLSYERRAIYDPNNTDLVLGAVYGYLATNFQGTFNVGAEGRTLWAGIPQCGSTYINPYPATLTSRDSSMQYTYENFDDIVTQIGRIYALNSEKARLVQERRDIDESDPRYAALTEQINVLDAQIGRLPALYRIQGLSMRWIDGYLNCINASQQDSAVKIKSPRIKAQISHAVDNLYAEGDDPTGGAFNRRNPNQFGTSFVLPISVPVDSVDRATANLYYSDGATDTVASCANYQAGAPDDVQYVDMLHTCYQPTNSTLIMPVLGIDVNANNDPVSFFWLGIAYQIENNIPLSRYDYDICEDGGKCR